MTDGQMDRQTLSFETDEDMRSGALTSEILSVVANRRAPAAGLLNERLLGALYAAACDGDSVAERRALDAMRASEIPCEAISDLYVSEIARRLGVAWENDELSFADVTIASARLQGLLRELGERDRGIDTDPVAPVALVIVPAAEHHTLGAMVVRGQLRRRGVSVRLAAGLGNPELLDLIAEQTFDMILVSWTSSETLDSLRKLVVSMRLCMERAAPVVVGGAVVDYLTDVEAQTGADHATCDIDEALALCGMTVSRDGARRRATTS
jgi:methanogenic corrinoid protein MtbC1